MNSYLSNWKRWYPPSPPQKKQQNKQQHKKQNKNKPKTKHNCYICHKEHVFVSDIKSWKINTFQHLVWYQRCNLTLYYQEMKANGRKYNVISDLKFTRLAMKNSLSYKLWRKLTIIR